MINVYTDGGARGNPGPAAIGVFISGSDGAEIKSISKTIGIQTNNVAEYSAVVEALSWLSEHKEIINNEQNISLFTDSQLVYSQIVGLFKIKNPKLRELLFKIHEIEAQINCPIRYYSIPREKNKEADRLVNMALDSEL